MGSTEPKSIFDIPKPLPTAEEVAAAQKPKKRKKKKIRKKPKVARAGGVEVSQKRNVKGQKQITVKHNSGLTQEITIYTGDQKPRGAKAKGQTANWNMKPAKFKRSRGLRDDRVYLQPPKREYFGNRYRSAMDKIRLEQRVKEAGFSKNKEIADVKETANRQKRELEQRERAKDETITDLRREKAGIVASHNVSLRNQSKATILGGDVGELNKLINRRGYAAIRRLVLKGEITDDSTILQLDLTQQQIDNLLALRQREQSEYVEGRKYVYVTPKGVVEEGIVLGETDKFLTMRRSKDGGKVKVPKTSIQTGREVLESRERSAERAGGGEAFGSPRKRTASEERERPAHRRDAKPRRKRGTPTPRSAFVGEADFSSGTASDEVPVTKGSDVSDSDVLKAIGSLRQITSKPHRPKTTGDVAKDLLVEAAEDLPQGSPVLPAALLLKEQERSRSESPITSGEGGSGTSPEEEALAEESGLETLDAPQRAPQPEPEPAGGESGLELILDEPAAERRAEFLEEGESGGGSVLAREDFSKVELPVVPAIRKGRKSIADTSEGQTIIGELDRLLDGQNLIPAQEIERRMRAAGITPENLPYYYSQLEIGRERDKFKLQRPKTFEEVRAAFVESPKRPTPSPAQRAGRERALKQTRGEPARSPRGRSRTPETEFVDISAIQEGKQDKLRLVDNRKEKQKGKGKGAEKPVKEYSFESIKAEIVKLYPPTGKKRGNLLSKLEEARAGNKAFYTNDAKLLAALGFR